MKKYFLMTCMIALSLTCAACGKTRDDVSEDNEIAQIVEDKDDVELEENIEDNEADKLESIEAVDESTSTDEPQVNEAIYSLKEVDFDTMATLPWQNAYYNRIKEREQELLDDGFICEITYSVYDIDKDSTPELILKYGTCEADYMAEIYTYKDDKVELINEDGAGHTSYYTDPAGGLINVCGHMGVMYVSRMSIVDGKGKSEEIFEENLNEMEDSASYTNISEIVPGVEYISLVGKNMLFPILELNKLSTKDVTGKSNDEIKQIFTDTYTGNSIVYAFDAYGFNAVANGEYDFTTFSERVIDQYSGTMLVDQSSYADLNGDGQDECILIMKPADGGSSTSYVVLSYQNGNVYAYIINYMDGFTLEGNVFTSEYSKEKLHFFLNEAYIEYLE